jgi:hypothetical protein
MTLPRDVCEAFGLRDPQIHAVTEGHINESWRVTTTARDLMVQRINRNVFPKPALVIDNAARAAQALRGRWKDGGLEFVATNDDARAYRDRKGNFWRASRYIPHAETSPGDRIERAHRAAIAFGQVLTGLASLDLNAWEDPIPGFHDLGLRLRALDTELQSDAAGRAHRAQDEIELVSAYRGRLAWPRDLPKRLIHGDCKLSNVLFDARGEVAAVVDLDTVMVGYAGWDFGDLVRSAASSAAEDEPDPTRIGLDMEVFEALAQGYRNSTANLLSAVELESLALGVPYITFMLGVRFLTDFLAGDRYFRIRRPLQNLHRARAQLELAKLMWERLDEMKTAVTKPPQTPEEIRGKSQTT